MIECPECGGKFAGSKCKCGYLPRSTNSFSDADHKRALRESERGLTEQAMAWNDMHAGTKGMTGEQRRKQLAAYRKRISQQTPVAKSDARAWAYAIVSRISDGELLPHYVVEMARAVVDGKGIANDPM
jgi:hypothetical protein